MTHLTNFVVIIGMVISIILILLLAKSKNKGLDKNVLIVIFVFFFFTTLHTYASLHQFSILYDLSYLFDYNLLWLLGPLLLLYTKSLFLDNTLLLRNNSVHFLPALFLTVVVFIPKMIAENSSMVTAYLTFYEHHQMQFIICRNFYFIFYLIVSIRLFYRFKSSLSTKLNFSLKEYSWMNKLFFGSLIFVSLDTFVRLFELLAYTLAFDGGFITVFCLVLFILFLGYFGVNESRVIIPAFALQKKEYAEITFTSEESITLERNIKSMLEYEKLYLDEHLSLKSLSESLEISDKKLSAFLNSKLNTRFKDYINAYRVAEVKEKLVAKEYQKFTLEAIATECGFNSKASFYRVFKKHTGYSPSQYKKDIKNR